MAPRNSRVTPDTQVRSPARSFAQSLDNFYAPARDVRSEQAFQRGLGAFSGILEEKAEANKAERNQAEHSAGIQDALREQAGEELQGVKNGSIFRQHSKFYMAGLNETRGKAAASRFKSDLALAYQDWEGKHTDDDGTAFREWMNGQVSDFVGTLGDDQYKVAGALPIINEVANNFAAQHTGFTAQRLEQESFEAYDEIVSGVFNDLSNGNIDLETAVSRIGDEADDMYATDGAAANDRVVDAAIRYANIHNDPEAILTLAKAHDNGRLKLSQVNRERLADAMDAVEADIERMTGKQNAQEAAAAKIRKRELQDAWYAELQSDPYADIGAWTASNGVEGEHFQTLEALQSAFIRGQQTENPQITIDQRMSLEMDLYSASSPEEKIAIIRRFQEANPNALSGADVSKYTKEVLEEGKPDSLMNSPIGREIRETFAAELGTIAMGNDFDMNKMPLLKVRGDALMRHYMMAMSGSVDTNDPEAMFNLEQDARKWALSKLEQTFPSLIREKAEGLEPEAREATGLSDVIDEADEANAATKVAADKKAFEGMINQRVTGEVPADPATPEVTQQSTEVIDPAELEAEPTPFDDPDSEVEYSPTREGFYGELIHRFTDGKDERDRLRDGIQVMQEDPEFKSSVEGLASKYSVPSAAILAVMDFETGGTFSTGVRNAAGSGATGLIQFMPATARALGTTTEELAQMSRAEQMVYVEKYFDQFANRIRGGQVDDIYMAVLWPKAIGKPDNYPIFTSGTRAYTQNAGLDRNKDGTVTKMEAAMSVKSKFYGYS